jgi:hypothetical protein
MRGILVRDVQSRDARDTILHNTINVYAVYVCAHVTHGCMDSRVFYVVALSAVPR